MNVTQVSAMSPNLCLSLRNPSIHQQCFSLINPIPLSEARCFVGFFFFFWLLVVGNLCFWPCHVNAVRGLKYEAAHLVFTFLLDSFSKENKTKINASVEYPSSGVTCLMYVILSILTV